MGCGKNAYPSNHTNIECFFTMYGFINQMHGEVWEAQCKRPH